MLKNGYSLQISQNLKINNFDPPPQSVLMLAQIKITCILTHFVVEGHIFNNSIKTYHVIVTFIGTVVHVCGKWVTDANLWTAVLS